MRKPRQALVLGPILLAFTMGSTDCDAYSDVVVPPSDPSAPTTFDGVWKDGTYVELLGLGPTGITYHLTPGTWVAAIASGLDGNGGIRKVTMSTEVGWLCCSGNICSSTSSVSAPIVETQAGGVGSTVSDGLYTGTIVGPTLPTCNPGYTLKSYRFGWSTTVENFHGKKATSAKHQIVYP